MSAPRPAHPYVPNSAGAERDRMLAAIGVERIDDLYAAIPPALRLPAPSADGGLAAERDLERHVGGLLALNRRVPLERVFAGAGCWPHHVPAVCEEILHRAEFRTAYWGNQLTDHGKYQAFFEYASLLGDLLELDAVSLPTYDWANAAAVALRMAGRITGRREVVLAGALGPERGTIVPALCEPDVVAHWVREDGVTGTADVAAVADALGSDTAALYVECPGYLGAFEPALPELIDLAHAAGALAVVGVDPSSLGVASSPAAHGADIVCGELQPLGRAMQAGGGLAGFIASADTPELVQQYPTFLIGLTPAAEGELGFGLVAWDRTSYMRRDQGRDFGGTTTADAAISAAVYLALLGPDGMAELGETIMRRVRYAAARLASVPGVVAPALRSVPFKELVVDLTGTGWRVEDVNRALLERGFVGGRDLTGWAPAGAERMLLCVTEVHDADDIDAFAAALAEIVAG
jgi:glycine dehydrogenase subunit 1